MDSDREKIPGAILVALWDVLGGRLSVRGDEVGRGGWEVREIGEEVRVKGNGHSIN